MSAHTVEDWGMDDFGFEPTPPLVASAPEEYQVFTHSPDFFSDLAPGETLVLDSEESHVPALRHIPSEWPAQLPMALAMDLEDTDSLLDRFGITREKFELLKPLPAFRKALAEAQRDLREQGHTFKLKCKGIAEEFLDQLYLELYNSNMGITTKVDVFKYLVKMGGLEPPPTKDVGPQNANMVQININL